MPTYIYISYFLNNYHRNMNKVVTTLLVLQILHSSVHSVGHHGDICHDQIDCSDSGDPHLHCTLTNDGNRCLCRTHFQLTTEVDSGKIRCTNNTPIKLNKMKPMNKETRLLVDNETRQKTSIWAPLIVIMMALIVILLCCCFLRIDPRAPHTHEVDEQVHEVKQTNGQLDDFDDIELNVAETSGIGVDNLGYDGEDCVSRHTPTTGIRGEVNQRNKIRTNPHVKESQSRKEQQEKEAVEIDANGNEKEFNDSSAAVTNCEAPTSEEPQFNDDDDDGQDAKKKISYESQLSTESTFEISQQYGRIERVRTDDETSIDTTIPPEEIILDPSKILDLVP